ncbi:MAG: SDR family NAD(P)-dependent oxidoreductase [Acidimicrobiia bacterium]
MTNPRVVLITGCSRGIGLAAAIAFARSGDQVVATMRDIAGSGDAVRAELEAAGVTADLIALDVTDQSSVDACFADAYSRYGRIDVLVNNAGLGYRGTLEELAIDDLQASLDVNFLGCARTMKAVLPSMRAAGAGVIINVSSVAGSFGQPFNDAYCAAKHALEGLCESLTPVARAFGVRVVVVEPGAVVGEFAAKGAGIRDVDPASPYAPMHNAYDTMMSGAYDGAPMSDEIAAAIVAAAGDPEASARIQVPESTARLIGVKLKDLSGERVVGITSKWLS